MYVLLQHILLYHVTYMHLAPDRIPSYDHQQNQISLTLSLSLLEPLFTGIAMFTVIAKFYNS